MKDKHDGHKRISTEDCRERLRAIHHTIAVGGVMLMLVFLLLSNGAVFAQSESEAQPDEQEAASSTRQLIVMSINANGGNSNLKSGSNCLPNRIPSDMSGFKRAIQKYHASLVLVNEIHRKQAYDLAHSLGFPDPYFIWTRTCKSGDRAKDYGNAIISRYRLVNRHRYTLHSLPSTNPSDNGRIVEYTMLGAASIVVKGRLIRVYCTHLTAGGTDEDREKQVRGILLKVPPDERDAHAGHRAILGEDLNFTFVKRAYKDLVKENDSDTSGLFLDAWKKSKNGSDPGLTSPAPDLTKRIDYVLLEKQSGFQVKSAMVGDTCASNGICLSDHLPVIVQLAIN